MEEYDVTYQHFDKLIWSVPAWCTATYAFILVSFFKVRELAVANNSLFADLRPVLAVIACVVLATMFAFSYALYRFRCHQDKFKHAYPVRGKWFFGLGAQHLLQFAVDIQFASVASLVVSGSACAFCSPKTVFVVVATLTTIIYELVFKYHVRRRKVSGPQS